MILLFGPAGAGKSVQGQLLTERLNWRWLSTGQLIRDSQDEKLHEIIHAGRLISTEMMNQLLETELRKKTDGEKLVLDGYPRRLNQAEWLIKHASDFNESVQLVVMIDVPESELVTRLAERGRVDDSSEIVADRLAIYHKETDKSINYLTGRGVTIEQVDGVGSIDVVHQRIKAAMKKHNLLGQD